ncbi:hypothetical protein [Sphingomonas glacialis]|uniref:hypothetical protein n=1 Tax=Sphingomonas glacialis TaxID=658225 RepID=UPI00112B33CD|nr:hypothetical protein [Sphingomonas glacialis]
MTKFHLHPEPQLVSRIRWLGAGALEGNDGNVPSARLIVCAAAAAKTPGRRNWSPLRVGIVMSGPIPTPPTRTPS